MPRALAFVAKMAAPTWKSPAPSLPIFKPVATRPLAFPQWSVSMWWRSCRRCRIAAEYADHQRYPSWSYRRTSRWISKWKVLCGWWTIVCWREINFHIRSICWLWRRLDQKSRNGIWRRPSCCWWPQQRTAGWHCWHGCSHRLTPWVWQTKCCGGHRFQYIDNGIESILVRMHNLSQ